MKYPTPKTLLLEEGIHTVILDSVFVKDGVTCAFKGWQDDGGNPVRIVDLNECKTIVGVYEEIKMKITNSTETPITVVEIGVIASTTLAPGEGLDTNPTTIIVNLE